jgi:hypothetical protein
MAYANNERCLYIVHAHATRKGSASTLLTRTSQSSFDSSSNSVFNHDCKTCVKKPLSVFVWLHRMTDLPAATEASTSCYKVIQHQFQGRSNVTLGITLTCDISPVRYRSASTSRSILPPETVLSRLVCIGESDNIPDPAHTAIDRIGFSS